jgi:hypothetical protein
MADVSKLATLIGDIVASRRHGDRRRLQESLVESLNAVNAHLDPVQPLALTIGDEFQGAFATVADAALASMLVRLRLLTARYSSDSRYGLGYGYIDVFDRRRLPASQDGPGWWEAREAIDRAKRLADAPRTSFARTCFGGRGSVEAFLLCRDAIVEEMNPRQRRLLLGFLHGKTQAQLADDEGITQPAVSQSLRHSGAFTIEAAHDALRREVAR